MAEEQKDMTQKQAPESNFEEEEGEGAQTKKVNFYLE